MTVQARSRRRASPTRGDDRAAATAAPATSNAQVQRQLNVASTPDGLAADGALARSRETGPGRKRTENFAGNAGLSVVHTPIAGSDPVAFEVVTRIELGVGIGASDTFETPEPKAGSSTSGGTASGGSAARKTNRSVSASASLTGSYENRRQVSESELERFLDAMDDALDGTASSAFPEARILAGEVSRTADSLLALSDQASGSPSAAKDMSAGDSFTITLDANASGSLDLSTGAGGKSIGGGFSGEAQWKRVLDVKRVSPQRVEITLAFVDASTLGGHVSGGVGAASMSLKGMVKEGSSDALVFAFDPSKPSFDSDYRAVCGADSRSDLAGLRTADFASGGLARETAERSEGDGFGTTAGAGGVEFAFETARERSDHREIDYEKSDVTGRVGTSTSSGATLSAGGYTLLSATETTGADGTVASDGEAELDLSRSKNGLLTRTKLSASAFDKLVMRGKDGNRWASHAVPVPEVMAEWRALGRRLQSPTIDPREAEVDPKAARELGQLRAVSDFLYEGGHLAMTALERCLNFGGELLGYQIDEAIPFGVNPL